jgi:hypothetical protein
MFYFWSSFWSHAINYFHCKIIITFKRYLIWWNFPRKYTKTINVRCKSIFFSNYCITRMLYKEDSHIFWWFISGVHKIKNHSYTRNYDIMNTKYFLSANLYEPHYYHEFYKVPHITYYIYFFLSMYVDAANIFLNLYPLYVVRAYSLPLNLELNRNIWQSLYIYYIVSNAILPIIILSY